MGPLLSDPAFTALAWLAVPALPLVIAALRVFGGRRGLAPRVAPLAVLPALAAAALPPAPARLPWLLLGAEMGLDLPGRLLLAMSAVVWSSAALFASGYLRGDDRRESFFTSFLLTMSGNLGLIVARDPATFYAAYALMTFAAYGLVVHSRAPAALRAGRVYLLYAVVGEALVATGLWTLVARGGGADPAAVAPGAAAAPFYLLLFGFGIKAGLVPLHAWLPLAHPVAPTPASAVLSGAMIKAGLLGGLRFLPALGPEAAGALVALGLAGALGGALYGAAQRDPKTILAYSSVSQMGWMVVGLAAAVARPDLRGEAAAAVALFALHHGLVKGGLFLSVGLPAPGHGFKRRLRRAGQVALALCLAGAPGTGGAAAKSALKGLSAHLPEPWPALLSWFLLAAAAGTVLLMVRFLEETWSAQGPGGEGDVPLWAAWVPLLLIAPAAPWAAARGSAWPGSDHAGTLAPLLAGAILGLAAGRLVRRRGIAWPAGDTVVPLEALTRELHAIWGREVGPSLASWRSRLYSIQWHEPQEVAWLSRLLDLGEGWWGRWTACGLLFVAVLIGTAVLLLP